MLDERSCMSMSATGEYVTIVSVTVASLYTVICSGFCVMAEHAPPVPGGGFSPLSAPKLIEVPPPSPFVPEVPMLVEPDEPFPPEAPEPPPPPFEVPVCGCPPLDEPLFAEQLDPTTATSPLATTAETHFETFMNSPVDRRSFYRM
jgi:hypothetical protein